MKKILIICSVVIIAVTMFTACSDVKNVNKEFNSEKMITISGNMVEINNEKPYSFVDPEFGFGFIGLDEWKPLTENALGLNIINEAEINLSYNQFDFLEIVRVNKDDKDSIQRWEDVKSRYTKNIEIFKKYDITMVNIWTTWCGFCVEEMPVLQELYSRLPENINMISICIDASEETEIANQILSDSKTEFTMIQGNDELNKTLLDNIQGYPTTIFVDKDGNIVGEPQVGAPESDEAKLVEAYMTLINKNLSEIEQ